MRAVLLVLVGAGLAVLAFPPFGPGILIVPGLTLFLAGLRRSRSRKEGLGLGALFGMVFFGGLMWWLSTLDLLAMVLIPVQASFTAAYGWWLAGFNDRPPLTWWGMATGGWGLMELIRYHIPFGGLEWGAAGYALSDGYLSRIGASAAGTSGLTVVVVALAAALALARTRSRRLLWVPGGAAAVLTLALVLQPAPAAGSGVPIAVVQGSTPCPFEHCPPDERLRTYQQHLELTRTIPSGAADIVVWSESSTGASNADPILNRAVREAIGAEAVRIGAWILVGGDRYLSDTEWVNANVVFDPDGIIVGEYMKQHPVPFGEYIPARWLFGRIPALSAVPRDMIPGRGPMVFPDVAGFDLGSVISFEGGFSRYALQHRQSGSDLLVVATNEASYGLTPASDQFIGMTRMRAVELGVPLVHAAVTGKSVIVDPRGDLGDMTGLGTREVLFGVVGDDSMTLYSRTGDLLLYLASAAGVLMWWRTRSLVGSRSETQEEE